MSRIQKFYDTRFRALAAKLHHPESKFVHDCFERADQLSARHHLKPAMGLGLVHAAARRAAGETHDFPKTFFCDVGLGGLARWLRGAGYESTWEPDLEDAAVIRAAQKHGATLLTTDSLMMERGVLRDGEQAAVWVPSSLCCDEQLAIVFHELCLERRQSRCMTCGGELCAVSKEQVADRIPPKTARWLHEYFVCAQCGQLFWRGTHWRKIMAELERISHWQILPQAATAEIDSSL